ncbi:cytochrome-c peroxidase [Bradyrhizobium sp. 2TAF36]|uniref:cytochrome-c peroxidase n=1 Tax=Bradyrhizobium sp. 2TAF36 TaxID=3233016 RepID=UPI003F9375F4
MTKRKCLPARRKARWFIILSAAIFGLQPLVKMPVEAAESGDLGPPPPLQPGKAPALPRPGPLAAPRSSDEVGFPASLTEDAIPPGSPITSASVALGEQLFFDRRLSDDGTVACATCHDPVRAFTDGRPRSVGIRGRIGQRNAPTILNTLYNSTQFWDGRVHTLEQQAALPITNPFEMGTPSIAEAVSRIADDTAYQAAFNQAYGRGVNEADMLRAIASYERTLTSFDSPFDRFIAGEPTAISDMAKHGWDLFNTKGRCNLCHALTSITRDTTVFTDNQFHNIGIGILHHDVASLAQQAERELVHGKQLDIDIAAIEGEMSVLGRFLVTKRKSDIGAFKTPGLRNVLITGPYFHDGSMQTLWDALDHYNHGDGTSDPWLDNDIEPLALTELEIDELVAFLASLTSAPYKDAGEIEYARQLALSKTDRPQRDTARAFGPRPKQPKPPMLNGP